MSPKKIIKTKKIKKIDEGVWCLESYFVSLGCRGSLRMTILETQSGLLLYSPVALSAEHVASIRALGTVSDIVAPNQMHHMYLRDCIAIFPDANCWVAEGLLEKIGPVDGARILTPGVSFGTDSRLKTFTVTGHRIQETLVFHEASGTLVTADMLYNYQSEQYAAEKLFFWMIGNYGRPNVAFYHRFSVKDKSSIRSMIDTIKGWPITRIIMSHGRLIESADASAIFAEAWEKFVK
jgi:hypothetical protein